MLLRRRRLDERRRTGWLGGTSAKVCAPRGRLDGDAEAEDDDLHHLRARGVVVRAEGAVAVAADDAVAVQVAHRLVEVVGRLHIAKLDRAGCGRRTRQVGGRGCRGAGYLRGRAGRCLCLGGAGR